MGDQSRRLLPMTPLSAKTEGTAGVTEVVSGTQSVRSRFSLSQSVFVQVRTRDGGTSMRASRPVCACRRLTVVLKVHLLRVVGPLGRGWRDPGPAMRGPAPGAEVALGKPSLLRPSSLADFWP